MTHIPSETSGQAARRGLTVFIVALGLIAIVFIDQSVHWILGLVGSHFEIPASGDGNPGLLFLFSLFFASATLFGFTILYRRSSDFGATRQGVVLGTSWGTATATLWFITLFLPEELHAPVFEGASLLSPVDASLFLIDQIARGAFFDLFETMGWSLTTITVNPDVWWFCATLVIFRTMTSVASVVVIVRVLGLRSQDLGLGEG